MDSAEERSQGPSGEDRLGGQGALPDRAEHIESGKPEEQLGEEWQNTHELHGENDSIKAKVY